MRKLSFAIMWISTFWLLFLSVSMTIKAKEYDQEPERPIAIQMIVPTQDVHCSYLSANHFDEQQVVMFLVSMDEFEYIVKRASEVSVSKIGRE